METAHLHEFLLLASRLNITNTAHELQITQSCLSKHIKQLETESGGDLFLQKNGKMYLTDHGSDFLKQSQTLLNRLDSLIDECHSLETSTSSEIAAQLPSMDDWSAKVYYDFFNQLKSHYTNCQILYSRLPNTHMLSNFKQGKYDCAIAYSYGKIREIQAKYAQQGCRAIYLASDRIIIWCNKTFHLNKDHLHIADLKDTPILTVHNVLAPMYNVTNAMCEAKGFKPNFISVSTKTQEEYLKVLLDNAVYVYPASLKDSPLLKNHQNMISRELEDTDAIIHSFLIISTLSESRPKEIENFANMYWKRKTRDL